MGAAFGTGDTQVSGLTAFGYRFHTKVDDDAGSYL